MWHCVGVVCTKAWPRMRKPPATGYARNHMVLMHACARPYIAAMCVGTWSGRQPRNVVCLNLSRRVVGVSCGPLATLTQQAGCSCSLY